MAQKKVRLNKLYAGFLEVAKTAVPYFAQWTYDHPMIIRSETNDTMRFLQKAMYKAIRHFVENYEEYRHLMPVSDAVGDILSLCKDVPYRVGTYRTDFLIDENKQIKLIEITCRFALNGFFIGKFTMDTVARFLQERPQIQALDQYTPFFDHLLDYFGNFDSLYVLRGKDHRNEDKYLLPIFENAGFPARIIEFEDIPNNMRLLKNAAVVGELAHEELCALPREVLEKIIHSNLINDLRTVFLIHDKRFFSVLGNDDFLCAAMSREEAERFHAHLVPTYAWNDRRDVWEQARQNKNDWIIKPRALGKGIGVQAGLFCDDVTWRAFFLQDNASDLTLQPYIHQAMIHGQIGDEVRPKDYAVGTLLFFDDNFFGPGFFRASSHPVTNQGDDRKIAPVVAALVDELDQGMAI